MKTRMHVVAGFAFADHEKAKNFAIALLDAKKIGTCWLSDSGNYESNEYVEGNPEITIVEKDVFVDEASAKQFGNDNILRKKMAKFEKEQETPIVSNIPF